MESSAFLQLLPGPSVRRHVILVVALLVVYNSFSRNALVEVAGFSTTTVVVTTTATRACALSSSCKSRQKQQHQQGRQHNRIILFAEGGGPPQYQKQEGILQRSERVGKGSYLLHIDYTNTNNNDNDNEKKNDGYEYEPGHVLALEIQPPDADVDADVVDDTSTSTSTSSLTTTTTTTTTATMNEKTRKDLETNGGWLRGPYTVSRGYGSAYGVDGFQVLVKEVGYKSNVYATSKSGTPVRFGGKFKVPIVEGIRTAMKGNNVDEDNDNDNEIEDDNTTKRAVMISTGVGVGPCAGAIEELLSSSLSSDDDDDDIVAIDLIASFRTRDEIAMASDLDKLQEQSKSDKPDNKLKSNSSKFHWKPVITGEVGRLSANGPDVLREQYLQQNDTTTTTTTTPCCMIRNTHYHVIGNGQLVNEWTAGLKKAGVPSTRVTTEAYFNHAAKPDAAAIDTICEAVRYSYPIDEKKEEQQQQVDMTTAAASA